MKRTSMFILVAALAVTCLLVFSSQRSAAQALSRDKAKTKQSAISTVEPAAPATELAAIQWYTVVNNSFNIPTGSNRFSSYSQPSVGADGLVVFRARSTGGKRETGIYLRKANTGKVHLIADLLTLVPYPNNLNSRFLEFSAIPRISRNTGYVGFLGLHKPVYRYTIASDEETRIGTSGIYVRLWSDLLITGAAKLAPAPGFEYFGVPGFKQLPFDIFPGAPAVTDDGTIVFKGNYQVDGVGKTGIFFRRLLNTPGGGIEYVGMIANSDSEIPGMPPDPTFRAVTFDSTAPPTVSGNVLVFLALDNEDDPYAGGVYIAPIKDGAPITSLVRIGDNPPNIDAKVPELKRLGEGLSFDGRYLSFWGAWGHETKTIRLYCPEDGNSELIAYCNGIDPNSEYDETTQRWYQEKDVPLNQGIFLYDLMQNRTYLAANTVDRFNDFLFWVYSGKVPGVGPDQDAEAPKWRSSAFSAVSGTNLVFKARTGNLGKDKSYVNPTDGLYMVDPTNGTPMFTIGETGMDGALFDSALEPGSMVITGLGVERDGFRGEHLAVTVTMANDEAGWGGIYITTIRGPVPLTSSFVETTLEPSFGKARGKKTR